MWNFTAICTVGAERGTGRQVVRKTYRRDEADSRFYNSFALPHSKGNIAEWVITVEEVPYRHCCLETSDILD
jgi:hypothetical protein